MVKPGGISCGAGYGNYGYYGGWGNGWNNGWNNGWGNNYHGGNSFTDTTHLEVDIMAMADTTHMATVHSLRLQRMEQPIQQWLGLE